MKIGDKMWHPCSMDIIEHKIIGVSEFVDERGKVFKHYTLKAVHNVGASGRIEVIIDEHKGNFRFVELVDEEYIQYARGLQDFVEGSYYLNKEDAELEFYEKQRMLAWSHKENQERLFKESKRRYEQVELLVKNIKEIIKERKSTNEKDNK